MKLVMIICAAVLFGMSVWCYKEEGKRRKLGDAGYIIDFVLGSAAVVVIVFLLIAAYTY